MRKYINKIQYTIYIILLFLLLTDILFYILDLDNLFIHNTFRHFKKTKKVVKILKLLIKTPILKTGFFILIFIFLVKQTHIIKNNLFFIIKINKKC